MSGGSPALVRRPIFEKSNTELISTLRANFAAQQRHQQKQSSAHQPASERPPFQRWTTLTKGGDEITLHVPTHAPTPLTEPRHRYDITVKLFYLPNVPAPRRCEQTREAITLVLEELGIEYLDLLIVSYPGISFDADDDDDVESSSPTGSDGSNPDADDLDTMLQVWRTLETLQAAGIIARLGVAEFSALRLSRFLPQTRVPPAVDQINVRDCCVVPKALIRLAKDHGIELLTHNDCTNVLPRGTLRELLRSGESGVGVLASMGDEERQEKDTGLIGEAEPQWVAKYTAVVKDRGVVESKGYFSVAELKENESHQDSR